MNSMKMGLAVLCLLVMLSLTAWAQADVLMVELPQDAQMIENIAFEDGDFIQTYQLSGRATIQLLRYASMDLSVGSLIASEWAGCSDVQDLMLEKVGGYPAEGLRFSYQEMDGETLDVTLVVVKTSGNVLVLQAVYPSELGEGQIDAAVQGMLSSLSVQVEEGMDTDTTAEVG